MLPKPLFCWANFPESGALKNLMYFMTYRSTHNFNQFFIQSLNRKYDEVAKVAEETRKKFGAYERDDVKYREVCSLPPKYYVFHSFIFILLPQIEQQQYSSICSTLKMVYSLILY